MYISSDVHNYMEKLIANELSDLGFFEKYNSDQVADLFCLILNRVPSIYIRNDIDMAYSMPDEKLLELQKLVVSTIKIVEPMIQNDRRHRVEEDIDAYFKSRAELEAEEDSNSNIFN
ncbi:MAG: late competence development ComFB family protein [Aliivibrio sp.]|uniref:late competence development ComFB family protein n=1 Tax=Aliivibrio sp. TaxID=1872443 RepID=UPI001A4B2808|nr:late competence development ComFB family protein [Aliivibrio sp.]